jgi:hypothetical protein
MKRKIYEYSEDKKIELIKEFLFEKTSDITFKEVHYIKDKILVIEK